MVCYWYEAKGGMFGTCEECAPDSAHDCPSEGDVRGCDLWSPFGGYAASEKEHYEHIRAIREIEEEESCVKNQQ